MGVLPRQSKPVWCCRRCRWWWWRPVDGQRGREGEYYYSPNKPAKLKVPKEVEIFKGKTKTVGIFPYNDVLLPLGTEMLNVLEMRHRQLLTEVRDEGTFGLMYYSQEQHKLGLVGTLARIKDRKLLDDGRVVAVIEGVDRFYIEKIVAEKPYIKAQVRVFQDYTEEKQEYLDAIENKIFDHVRLNLKFLKLLYPQKKYSLSANLVKYRPPSVTSGIRSVRIMDEASELDRRSKFSFAVTEMLSIAAPTKLVLMQDHLIEKRFARSLRILERGCEFMKNEIQKKNLMTAEGLERLQRDLLMDNADVEEIITPSSSWQPENFVNGQWVQRPTLF